MPAGLNLNSPQPAGWRRRRWRYAADLLLLLLVLASALALADRIILRPPPPDLAFAHPALRALPEPPGGGGELSLFYRPPPPGGRVILYSHGNAEDLAQIHADLDGWFTAAGYGLAAYDYSGYGFSGGSPSERAVYSDAARVWQFLTEAEGLEPEQIILYGRSVGSGPAVWLAQRHAAAALVLEAPFTSAFAVARLSFLPFDRFDNARRIGTVKTPVLIIHGESDEVIPWSHGRRLHELAPEPRQFHRLAGAGHNDLMDVAGRQVLRVIEEFLRQHGR